MKKEQRFMAEPLPYDYTALAPALSEETLRFHHDKHAAGYAAKLNELLEGSEYDDLGSLEEVILAADGAILNNAAQLWNHNFYFEALAPAPKEHPTGVLATAIERAFGSFDLLREQMLRHCAALFGSGWVWLVRNREGVLEIMDAPNAGNPLCHGAVPLLCIDVWEHAYYIDYRNARADAVAALWGKIDWAKVEQRFEAAEA